jgi:hypothetical protein
MPNSQLWTDDILSAGTGDGTISDWNIAVNVDVEHRRFSRNAISNVLGYLLTLLAHLHNNIYTFSVTS